MANKVCLPKDQPRSLLSLLERGAEVSLLPRSDGVEYQPSFAPPIACTYFPPVMGCWHQSNRLLLLRSKNPRVRWCAQAQQRTCDQSILQQDKRMILDMCDAGFIASLRDTSELNSPRRQGLQLHQCQFDFSYPVDCCGDQTATWQRSARRSQNAQAKHICSLIALHEPKSPTAILNKPVISIGT